MDNARTLRSIFNKLNSGNLKESASGIAQIHAQIPIEEFRKIFISCLFENLQDIGLFYTEIVLNFASLTTLILGLDGCSNIVQLLFSHKSCDANFDTRSKLVFFLSCLYLLDDTGMITPKMFIDFFLLHVDDELPLLIYSFLKSCNTKLLSLQEVELRTLISSVKNLAPVSVNLSFRWNFLFETINNLKNAKFRFRLERAELIKAKKSIQYIQRSLNLNVANSNADPNTDKKLHTLAKKLKFNSPSRFLIFSCLVNHRHDMYRIVLDLSRLAEAMNRSFLKEISTVIFRCCIHEKDYNNFYQQVMLKIDAELGHKLHSFFQSTCSNFVANISLHTARSISNAARYFSALALAKQLDIEKVRASSSVESKRHKLFFQILDSAISKLPKN